MKCGTAVLGGSVAAGENNCLHRRDACANRDRKLFGAIPLMSLRYQPQGMKRLVERASVPAKPGVQAGSLRYRKGGRLLKKGAGLAGSLGGKPRVKIYFLG